MKLKFYFCLNRALDRSCTDAARAPKISLLLRRQNPGWKIKTQSRGCQCPSASKWRPNRWPCHFQLDVSDLKWLWTLWNILGTAAGLARVRICPCFCDAESELCWNQSSCLWSIAGTKIQIHWDIVIRTIRITRPQKPDSLYGLAVCVSLYKELQVPRLVWTFQNKAFSPSL